jgi:glycosyltransferase involved in cell wall biosynthesis
MRIVVVTNCAPFLHGGAEHLAAALSRKLCEVGHESLLVRIPFRWEPAEKVLESMLACRLLRLPNIERVIALKFPAYYIPHDHKILWLLHQFRQVYDFWGTPFQGIPNTSEGHQIRQAVVQSDNHYLSQVRRIYTNSGVTSGRLKTFNNIESEVLWPPLLESKHFRCETYEDFIFYPSRVNVTKRQHLVVEAMRYVKSDARLILAGQVEEESYRLLIEGIIRDCRLESRVHWMREFIPEEQKAELFSRALGCAYVPYDEDSYGYVTLEAFSSRKPVIACSDSGGTDVLVRDGSTGLVVTPSPQAIAEAIDRLYMDRRAAQAMGEAGFELMRRLGITWENVISRLTHS